MPTPSETETWWEYMFGRIKQSPMYASDAAHDHAIRAHFNHLLIVTDPPESFTPSDVARLLTRQDLRRLGYEDDGWQAALPAVYELAFEMREFGDCELLRKKGGGVLGEDVGLLDLKGPIWIRRKEG